MKTRKQVLAEFQRMQKQLYGKFGFGSFDVSAYDGGDGYWSVRILVSRWSEERDTHDVWEQVEWNHYSTQNERNEQNNEEILKAFKEKFNLK